MIATTYFLFPQLAHTLHELEGKDFPECLANRELCLLRLAGHIAGSVKDGEKAEEILVEAAGGLLQLLHVNGIYMPDELNRKLNSVGKTEPGEELHEFIRGLVDTLVHRDSMENVTRALVSLYEANPGDEELRLALDDIFGEALTREDKELRTSRGFENFVLLRRAEPVLVSIAEWVYTKTGETLGKKIELLIAELRRVRS